MKDFQHVYSPIIHKKQHRTTKMPKHSVSVTPGLPFHKTISFPIHSSIIDSIFLSKQTNQFKSALYDLFPLFFCLFLCLPLIRCSWHTLSLFLSHLFMAMPDILFYTGLLFYLTARCSPMDGVGAERGSGSRPTSDFSWGAFMKKKMWGIVLVASMVFESVQRFMYQIFTHTHKCTYLASEATGIRRGNTLWYLDCFVIISHTWFVKIKAILKHSVKVCFLMFRNPYRHSKTPRKTLKQRYQI